MVLFIGGAPFSDSECDLGFDNIGQHPLHLAMCKPPLSECWNVVNGCFPPSEAPSVELRSGVESKGRTQWKVMAIIIESVWGYRKAHWLNGKPKVHHRTISPQITVYQEYHDLSLHIPKKMFTEEKCV